MGDGARDAVSRTRRFALLALLGALLALSAEGRTAVATGG